MEITWLLKALLAHLFTDFFIQRNSWIEDKNKRHVKSPFLYVHVALTMLLLLIFIGIRYWPVVLIVGITHWLLDLGKSYMSTKLRWFLIDQALHIAVILAAWLYLFYPKEFVWQSMLECIAAPKLWLYTTAFALVSFPAGIFIGKFTEKWRLQIASAPQEGLADAGKWIGILERTIILLLVLQAQWSAIGLLIAAKSILRFNETKQEAKTEYVLIGSLISIGLALVIGMIVKNISVNLN